MKKALKLTSVLMAALVVMSMGFAAPAHADPRGHGRGGGHWDHYHHWHGGYAPGVVYAPAPVVYAPPEPSPGINLVVPLHFH
jgi:hypothetical protein